MVVDMRPGFYRKFGTLPMSIICSVMVVSWYDVKFHCFSSMLRKFYVILAAIRENVIELTSK